MAKPATLKTKQTEEDVEDFIKKLPDETRRDDSRKILSMMQKATDEKPKMWGTSMIGFGKVRYKSPSGREVDWFKIGFAPRKSNFSLHLVLDIKKHSSTLEKLGKHKTGAGCLYINKLDDIDLKVLEKLINTAAKTKPSNVE